MCGLCESSKKEGEDFHSPEPKAPAKAPGNPDRGANRDGKSGKSPEQLFSDDENEKNFIADICWIKKDHWIRSEMKWNTIHGIPWKRLKELGEGAFGSVCVGIREDHKLFAIKSINVQYPLTKHCKQRIKTQVAEIKMMRYLRSKYIIRCLGCGRSNKENGLNRKETLDVFLELAIVGSLRNVYKRRSYQPFNEVCIRQYTYDLLKALQYMHRKRVVHGDIKMGNVLLAEDCVKLCDWGGAKQLRPNNLKQILIGTSGFESPEVRRFQQQSYPSDIFSLGCTVIEMATGMPPSRILAKVMGLDKFMRPTESMEERVAIPDDAGLSPECKDFLQLCLCQKVEDRWTAAELLHHPFIANRDKKSTKLPYRLIEVPARLPAKLLQPPRRIDPDLPDEPVTKRVYRHLTRKGVPRKWVANLAGCRPTDPPLYPPSPEYSKRSPDPVPVPLVPEIQNNPHKNPLQAFLNFITPQPKSSDYVEPKSSQHLIVESPINSSILRPVKVPSGSHGVSTVVSATALAKNTIGTAILPPVSEETTVKISVPNARDNLHHMDEAKEFHNEMLNSLSLMREVNKELYEEAEIAAQQPLLDSDSQDRAFQLFPKLRKK